MSVDESLQFRAGGSTTIGVNPHRQLNEDFLFIDRDLGLFAVFDAGGSWEGTGERTGPLCSAIFQNVIRDEAGPEAQEVFGRAFRLAGEAIREEISRAEPEGADCSWASVILALVRDGRAHISWLGDAMAHGVKGDRIEPLTRPHTLWDELVRRGNTPTNQGFRNVRMYSLGTAEFPDPLEVISFTPQPGDRLVLTTDGVTNHIPDSTILNACRVISDPTTCAEAIIEHAIMAGSRDNCTCVVIAFEGADDGPASVPVLPRKWWRFWK